MHKKRGFTIVELLIVIVIIAILAAITIVAYNGITTRSKASAIAADLKSIEKALNLYKQTVGLDTWPNDSDATYLTGTSNPSIGAIITAQPVLRSYLPKAPTVDGIGASNIYQFDNDGDTYNGCSNSTSGVNIYIANATNTALMQAVDDAVDDGNLSCGKFRQGGTSFHYNISPSP